MKNQNIVRSSVPKPGILKEYEQMMGNRLACPEIFEPKVQNDYITHDVIQIN